MRKRVNYRLLINLVVIIIVGIFSGHFVGNYYIDNFTGGVLADVLPSEDSLRDDVSKVLRETSGKSVTQIGATQNFVLAEYYLQNYSSVKKLCTGTVTAMGVTQSLVATRIKMGDEYFGEEISCKTGAIGVNYAQRFYYTAGVDSIPLYNGSNITPTSASWPASPSENHTMETFRAKMGIGPTYFQNYIISSKTVIDEQYLGEADGGYKFQLKLHTQYSVKNYMYKVRATSGGDEFPMWEESTVTFVIDNDWKFVSIHYNESYKVKIPGLGRFKTVGNLTETFDYGGTYEIPTIN